MLTLDQVQRALPPNLKTSATPALLDLINGISSDPIFAEQVRSNFISYTSVLRDGKYKTEDYVNAVTYVSFKLLGHSNQDAYFKTFPVRHANLVAKGTSSKDIAAYVSAYNKGKLVNAIMEQTLVPSWVLNQHMYQEALNVQADLMINSHSDKVRCDAANSILTHLAKPKEAGPLINIDMRENSGMNELKDALAKMAAQQQGLIQAGMSSKDVAAQRIVHAEVIENGSP
jgi:hypothetical protein